MKVITFRSEDDSKNTVTPRLDLRRLRGPVFELVIEPVTPHQAKEGLLVASSRNAHAPS